MDVISYNDTPGPARSGKGPLQVSLMIEFSASVTGLSVACTGLSNATGAYCVRPGKGPCPLFRVTLLSSWTRAATRPSEAAGAPSSSKADPQGIYWSSGAIQQWIESRQSTVRRGSGPRKRKSTTRSACMSKMAALFQLVVRWRRHGNGMSFCFSTFSKERKPRGRKRRTSSNDPPMSVILGIQRKSSKI